MNFLSGQKKLLLLLPILLLVLVLVFVFNSSQENISEDSADTKQERVVRTSSFEPADLSSYSSLSFSSKKDGPLGTNAPLYTSLSDFLKEKGVGIIPSSQPTVEKNAPSEAQIALKSYGNTAGKVISGNTNEALDEIAIFKAIIENNQDKHAKETALIIAEHYRVISEKLSALTVDTAVSNLHEGLAKGYGAIGEAMRILVTSNLEVEDFLAYNKALPIFIDGYMNLVLFLRASGVVFEESEPGSIFTLQL